jgi:hypothetical protein
MLVFRICSVLHTNRVNEDYRVCDSQSCCSLLVAKQLLAATTAISGRSNEVRFLECGGRIESFTAFCERDEMCVQMSRQDLPICSGFRPGADVLVCTMRLFPCSDLSDLLNGFVLFGIFKRRVLC